MIAAAFWLRPLMAEDVAALEALAAEPLVHRYLFDGAPPAPGMVADWIAARQADAARTGLGAWALVGHRAGIDGWVWLEPREEGCAELGYALHPSHWGRGLATRMAWTLIADAFARGLVREIRAGTDGANAASVRVMERLGMRFRGIVNYPLGPGAEFIRRADDPLPVPLPEALPFSLRSAAPAAPTPRLAASRQAWEHCWNMRSAASILRRLERARPGLSLGPDAVLALGRVHEVCGPARRSFAALVARRLHGPVLWVIPEHERERVNADGCLPWFDPARLVLVPARRPADLLWAMEEALRSGACPLVVVELPEPPALTPVRRLQLAAEARAAQAGAPPLGLILTPGEGGAPGVEGRWHLAPLPGWALGGGGPRWRLTRLRARRATAARWTAEAAGSGLRLQPAGPE
ncbi:MAG TPA: GNAT family N-acetyltransferase [Paracoccaceae bacterium]|nr:GNAT family N-acetyltransferase [Paracoccaceae bacterium]